MEKKEKPKPPAAKERRRVTKCDAEACRSSIIGSAFLVSEICAGVKKKEKPSQPSAAMEPKKDRRSVPYLDNWDLGALFFVFENLLGLNAQTDNWASDL